MALLQPTADTPAGSTERDIVPGTSTSPAPLQSGQASGEAYSPVTLPPGDSLPAQPRALSDVINILLLGIDRRADEAGPCRTDTMIVVTVDLQAKTAALLSIPRDLWVPIPGHREARINTAHFYGEVDDGATGGPALAKKTVQQLLGVPIDHYVRINFQGLLKLIDLIGGIQVHVEKRIYDTKYPDENYGYTTIDIPAGVQTMDGETVLKYVRTRHGGSDFIRARRQQQVIKAMRDKALALDVPLARIPTILSTLGNTVQTDLSLADMYTLARLGREIPAENIGSATIDETMTRPHLTYDGNDVLLPDYPRIEELVSRVFGSQATAQDRELAPSVYGDS